MTPESVSSDRVETTRKNGARIYGQVLRRLAEVTQDRAAACMSVHPSTISRSKDDIEKACHLLAALGFQLSATDSVVVSREEIQALEGMALKYLQARVASRDGHGD